MAIRDDLLSEFDAVASQQGKTLPMLDDDTNLLDSGFDSLCFAILVARLEDRLGLDPFSRDDVLVLPQTFGDFVRLYETAPV